MDEDVQYVGMRLPPIDFTDGLVARRSGPGGTSTSGSGPGVQPRMDTYGITLAVQRRADQPPYDVSFHRSGGGAVEIGRKSSSARGSGGGGGGGRTTNTERYAVFACQVVSAKHAKLMFTASGQVYIVDLDSRHGTHILKRGEDISHTIQPGVETVLDDGDLVTFGKTVGSGRQMVEPVTVRVKLLRRTLRTTATASAASAGAGAAGTAKNNPIISLGGYPSDSDSSTSLPSPPWAKANGDNGNLRVINVDANGGGGNRNSSAGRYGLFEHPSELERSSSDDENEHENENEEGDAHERRSERGNGVGNGSSPAMPTFSFGTDDPIDVEDWRSTLHEPLLGDLLAKDVDAEYLIDDSEHALAALEAAAQEEEEDDEDDEEDGPMVSRLETPSEMDMGTPAPDHTPSDEAQSEADMDMETPREQSRASSHAPLFDLHLLDVPTHLPELLDPSVEPEEITFVPIVAPATQAEGQHNGRDKEGPAGAATGTGAGEQATVVGREDLPSLRTILSDITPTPFERDVIPVPGARRLSGSPVERHMSVPASRASDNVSEDDDQDDEDMNDEADRAAAILDLQTSCEHIQNELGELYSSVDTLENDVHTISEDLEDVHAHLERLDRLSDTSVGRLQAVENRLSALAGIKTQVEGLQARMDSVAAMPQDKEDKEEYMRELKDCTKDLNVVVADIRELHRETKQRLSAAVEEILAARKEALTAIQSEVQAFKTLKRKRSEPDMADAQATSVPPQPVVTPAPVTQSHSPIIIQPPSQASPPRKRARRVLSLTARTATAVAFGAVVTWSALAFS